jgi:flagellin
MLTINTNIGSLTAQQNLQNNGLSLNTSLQRLSSGLRINSAADDAAGLAISDRFTTQINGLGQAAKNANDGISLSQTAGGALAQVTANLQAIRQLAVQSANATNSASDRAALDQAVQQDIAEINRIANQTSFNNRNILDGTFGTATFQVGANVGQTISIALNTSAQTTSIGAFYSSIGSAATTVAGTLGGVLASSTINTTPATNTGGVTGTGFDGTSTYTVNGTSLQASSAYAVTGDATRGAGSAYALAAAVNASGVAGVTASAATNLAFAPVSAGNAITLTPGTGGTSSTYTLQINGVQAYTTGAVSAVTNVTVASIEAAINQTSAQTGVTAGTDSAGKLTLSAADGRDITLNESVTDVGTTTAATQFVSAFSGTDVSATGANQTGSVSATWTGQVNLSSGNTISLSAGAEASLGFASTVLAATSNLASQNVRTVQGANNTIQSVDSALASMDNLNSTFGAIQNRFQSTIASLGTAVTNLSAARSRIQDADFAAETSNLTRAQILQQAGTSILAQANAIPQGVLKLLQ